MISLNAMLRLRGESKHPSISSNWSYILEEYEGATE